ncbi:MAG TPA: HEAT repeat domain-containing protein, partial [Planctomycetaceae bacterium]|nr:HEAT repeat domain-containing protein [Planctomycetaceae bacterium]
SPKTYDGLTVEEWRERLINLGPGVPGSVQAVVGLTELVGDRTAPPLVRQQAAMMLGRIGRPSLTAIPTLEKLLSEPGTESESPALWGAKALALLGPLAKETTPRICVLLLARETARGTRLACVEALAQIGGHHPKAIPTLIGLLEDSIDHESPEHQLELRRAAADALRLIGGHASTAVPTLMNFLDHKDELLRAKAVGALGAMGPAALPSASVVAERLVFDDVDHVRKRAAFALGQFGPEVNELLIVLSEDEEPEVRRLSLLAISEQPTLDPKIQTAIVNALQDADDSVRLEAIKASVSHRILRSDCLQVGIGLLFSKNRTVSVEAAKQLEKLKPTQAEIEALFDREKLESNARARELMRNILRYDAEGQR